MSEGAKVSAPPGAQGNSGTGRTLLWRPIPGEAMSITEELTIVNEAARPAASGFSWSAALVGAVIAAATMFFLLTLGAGVGLALTTTPRLLHGQAPAFLTLGGIYFFAALAFSFALGAHVTGRLITPEVETRKEESFLAAAHGLAVWAIATAAIAALAGIGALASIGFASSAMTAKDSAAPAASAYWVDVMFRPSLSQQSSLDGVRYAQADIGTATDAAPGDQPSGQMPPPAGQASPAENSAPSSTSPAMQAPVTTQNVTPSEISPAAGAPPLGSETLGVALPARNVAADKAEAGRILSHDLLDRELDKSSGLPNDDRQRLANLVLLDVGMDNVAAHERVDSVVASIRDDRIAAAETARRVASDASLWAAFALLFGALVSIMSAIAARHEDDRIRFFG